MWADATANDGKGPTVCGFAGEIRFDGARADVAAVERMASPLAPRGPDGAGSWSHAGVALSHRRLRIIDLTDRGAQPMTDHERGLAVVFNGCIYNHAELREQLVAAGHRFVSTSDTEVLLRGYAEWGADVVTRLNGMFAFAVHDLHARRTVLGRDRLGIKPLYLASGTGRLRFASTLPALVAGGEVDTAIDPVALHHYLTLHAIVPAPRTILAGVRKLPPATVLTVEADGTQRQRTYWQLDATRDPDRADWSGRDWEDAVLAALRLSVERRLVADVDVGVLLSGGLDSSLVVGLLAEAGQSGLATFSIGFEAAGGHAGDEFAYSDVIAERFATDHHRIRIGDDRLLPALGRAIAAMSEPMVSHDVVAFHLLSEEVSRHRKVVQSGQGADEVFAGYHWYPPMVGADDPLAAYAEAFFDRDDQALRRMVQPDHHAPGDPTRAFVDDHFARPGAATAVDRALRLDTTVMLVDDPVKRVDNMTMAFGLEARVPFLDHEVVELAARCPPDLKLAHGGKGVLKQAARRVIPADVIDRPKGYFPVPALTHLDGGALDLVRDALTAPEARKRGLFEPAAVDALLDAPNDGLTRLGGNRLWQIGLLELWLQIQGIAP